MSEIESVLLEREVDALVGMALAYAADGELELATGIAEKVERLAPWSPRYLQLQVYLDEEGARRQADGLVAGAREHLAAGRGRGGARGGPRGARGHARPRAGPQAHRGAARGDRLAAGLEAARGSGAAEAAPPPPSRRAAAEPSPPSRSPTAPSRPRRAAAPEAAPRAATPSPPAVEPLPHRAPTAPEPAAVAHAAADAEPAAPSRTRGWPRPWRLSAAALRHFLKDEHDRGPQGRRAGPGPGPRATAGPWSSRRSCVFWGELRRYNRRRCSKEVTMRLVHAAALTAAVLLLASVGVRPGPRRRRGPGEGEEKGRAGQAGQGLHRRRHRPVDGAGDVRRPSGDAAGRRRGARKAGAAPPKANRRGGQARRGRPPARPPRPNAAEDRPSRGGGPGQGGGGLAQATRPGAQGRSRLQGHHRQAPAPAQRHAAASTAPAARPTSRSWTRTSRSSPRSRRASRRSRTRAAATAIAEPARGRRARSARAARGPR